VRIVSLSDIHGELDAFDNLIDCLSGLTFDVIVIAGDIGERKEAKVIFRELAAYGKPIFYVMGNWDDFSYSKTLNRHAVHIHLNHQRVGEWVFLGYSGSTANGFRGHPTLSNSKTIYESNYRHNKRKYGCYESYCRSLASEELRIYISEHEIDVEELVLVSHERFYSLTFFPLLYVFGHRHQPKYTRHKGVNLVNTSAISTRSFLNHIPPDAKGNFCLIELNGLNCSVHFHEIPSPYLLQQSDNYGPGVFNVVSAKTGIATGEIYF